MSQAKVGKEQTFAHSASNSCRMNPVLVLDVLCCRTALGQRQEHLLGWLCLGHSLTAAAERREGIYLWLVKMIYG